MIRQTRSLPQPNRNHSLPLIVVTIAMAVLAFSCHAQSESIITAVDESLIDQVLTQMQLDCDVQFDDNADPSWTFEHLGILISLIPYDAQTPGSYESLLFYAGWSTQQPVSLQAINAWNRDSRFGRAYLDSEGDPVIELDLLMTGGVTLETIQVYITVFAQAASSLGVALAL